MQATRTSLSAMDRAELESLLRGVAAGGVDVDTALARLAEGPMAGAHDLGFARVDTHRGVRTGDPEVVYAAGKSPEQTVEILRALAEPAGQPARGRDPGDRGDPAPPSARPSPARWWTRRRARWRSASCRSRAARCAWSPPAPPTRRWRPRRPSSARAFGAGVRRVDDVGVAGLHRLLAVRAAAGRGRLPRRRRRHGRRAAERRRRADRRTARRGADVGRVRDVVRRAGRAARDAELLRARRRGVQHRQRVRRRRLRGAGGPARGARRRRPRRDGRLGRRLGRRQRRHAARGARRGRG